MAIPSKWCCSSTLVPDSLLLPVASREEETDVNKCFLVLVPPIPSPSPRHFLPRPPCSASRRLLLHKLLCSCDPATEEVVETGLEALLFGVREDLDGVLGQQGLGFNINCFLHEVIQLKNTLTSH